MFCGVIHVYSGENVYIGYAVLSVSTLGKQDSISIAAKQNIKYSLAQYGKHIFEVSKSTSEHLSYDFEKFVTR